MAVEGSTGADNEEDTGAAFSADDTEFNIFNTDRKLSALESAAKMLGSLSGKEGTGVFRQRSEPHRNRKRSAVGRHHQRSHSQQCFVLSDRCARPGGVRRRSAMRRAARLAAPTPYPEPAPARSRAVSPGQQETLYTLAADTGGKALLDNNDLALGIVSRPRRISPATTSSATTAPMKRLMATTGGIKLTPATTLSARIGKLDYRRGYFAGKEFRNFTSGDSERQLQEALMLGDPLTDLTIAMEVNFFRLARDRYYVPITLKIPGSEFELAKHGGAESTKIDFIGEVKDAKGKVAGQRSRYERGQAQGRNCRTVGKAHPGLQHRLHPRTRHILGESAGARKPDRQDGDIPDQVHGARPDRRGPSTAHQLGRTEQSARRHAFGGLQCRTGPAPVLARPAGAGQQAPDSQRNPRLPKEQEMYVYLEAYRAQRAKDRSRWWPASVSTAARSRRSKPPRFKSPKD